MRTTCPRLGHLVRARRGSPLHRDAKNNFPGWLYQGLVVATRGIEVHVLLSDGIFSWVRRDNVEVISEYR